MNNSINWSSSRSLDRSNSRTTTHRPQRVFIQHRLFQSVFHDHLLRRTRRNGATIAERIKKIHLTIRRRFTSRSKSAEEVRLLFDHGISSATTTGAVSLFTAKMAIVRDGRFTDQATSVWRVVVVVFIAQRFVGRRHDQPRRSEGIVRRVHVLAGWRGGGCLMRRASTFHPGLWRFGRPFHGSDRCLQQRTLKIKHR